jgi:GTPase SAR1 family protein
MTNAFPYVLTIGMAGSGKTTFVHRLAMQLLKPFPVDIKERSISLLHPFLVNLDPAVLDMPYSPDIDIRDTIPYKETMEKYKLGPNGAILTCLNLYAAQFDKVMKEIEALTKFSDTLKMEPSKDISDSRMIVFDTPGQIELFTWSAAGSIMTECLSGPKDESKDKCFILYVLDTTICKSPTSFMSNMLYACSIMYKTKLPMILVLNKIDLERHEHIMSWMTDWESFQEALHGSSSESGNIESQGSMMTGFVHSLSLVLEEFYRNIKIVGVSSTTGEGFDELLEVIAKQI